MNGTANPRTDALLAAHSVVMQFGGMRAVDGMSLELKQGEIFAPTVPARPRCST